MRILKALLSTLVVLAVVFVIGGFFIPAEWTVSRSIMIHATAENIYPFVKNFKKWEKWSPWSASKDASLKYTYEGPKSGVGAKQSWTSNSMGKGWMQFTAANPQTGVAYDLFIDMGSSQSTLHGQISFSPEGENTTVTWTDQGNSGDSFVKRWMSLALRFMLAKNFDTGLADLKTLVEKK
ncbi:MAG: SRPBCC family protein [Gammaproteobacteria bacterium]|nr:SRPBCC family protein [Gammaproteobacteria bacterium]